MTKQDYFIPDSMTRAEFDVQWLPVEARLKKILPLKTESGAAVDENSEVLGIDLFPVADCLTGLPDETGLIERFYKMVEKKNPEMTVGELLARPAGEITRWRKMGNRIVLIPNALVLHMNS
jgi:hypothetical protein